MYHIGIIDIKTVHVFKLKLITTVGLLSEMS